MCVETSRVIKFCSEFKNFNPLIQPTGGGVVQSNIFTDFLHDHNDVLVITKGIFLFQEQKVSQKFSL